MATDPLQNLPMAKPNARVDCGWGMLIFGNTFDDDEALVTALCDEGQDKRNIAFYIDAPHVVLSVAPHEVFLDPSDTLRLDLTRYKPLDRPCPGVTIGPAQSPEEAETANRIYAHWGMMQVPTEIILGARDAEGLNYLVARSDESGGEVVGVVMGVDHVRCFNDPENGSSLWSLAVDPQAPLPGIGEKLVRALSEQYIARGRSFMDLSVIHTNKEALKLYDRLGFEPLKTFTLKKRNTINERLYTGPNLDKDYNPYARLIIDEARRRGIAVDPLDPAGGFFKLTCGGRSITCRESLSELSSAVAMSRCDDKRVTRRLMQKVGLRVPGQQVAGTAKANAQFLEQYGRIVVKPSRGEQGTGVAVDLTTREEVENAVAVAGKLSEKVLLEEFCEGDDLRIIVIGDEVVAAAIRKPAEVMGTGEHTVRQLIDIQSRRRAAATGGEIFVRGARQLDMMTFLNTYREMGGEFDITNEGIRFYRAQDMLKPLIVETNVHPGFMTDWQQPLATTLTQAEGVSIIHETVYEDRFGYVSELRRMGAKIQLHKECLGHACRFGRRNHYHSAVIVGPARLHGEKIVIPDLRAGFSYLIAALMASGTSEVDNIGLIQRGYEDFEDKLRAVGADIERVDD